MSAPETVAGMLARVPADADRETLIAVADAWIGKWAALAEEQAATGKLDGRASIYTGETYAQARDRWAAYRAAVAMRGTSHDPSHPSWETRY